MFEAQSQLELSTKLRGSLLVSGSKSATESWINLRVQQVLSHPYSIHLHPDYCELRPAVSETNSIKVEEVRALIEFLSLTPKMTDQRVVVIWQAEQLRVGAGNALLKTLEEPPKTALIFLVSEHPQRLLATIRSRCLHIRLKDPHPPAYLSPLTQGEIFLLDHWLAFYQGQSLFDTVNALTGEQGYLQLLYSWMKLAYWVFRVLQVGDLSPHQALLTESQYAQVNDLVCHLGKGTWPWIKELTRSLAAYQAGVPLNLALHVEHLLIQSQAFGKKGICAFDAKCLILND